MDVLRGMALSAIAETYEIRPETVKKHLSNIFIKFGAEALDEVRVAIDSRDRG